jgi:hypothetical protein
MAAQILLVCTVIFMGSEVLRIAVQLLATSARTSMA